MTVVIGASELLLESELDPEQRLAAQHVHRSGQAAARRHRSDAERRHRAGEIDARRAR